MIPSSLSSSPQSGHLSLVLSLAAGQDPTNDAPPAAPSQDGLNVVSRGFGLKTNPGQSYSNVKTRKNRKTKRLRKTKPKALDLQDREEGADAGERSPSTSKVEEPLNPFFGLGSEYSFTYEEDTHNPSLQCDPDFTSFIESAPEMRFVRPSPQYGRTGLDRYLATPNNSDPVRYYPPNSG
ncbi:hypothetical protein TWF694_009655 [Orbilia ellipsospora]|uniref:Uncharacterized protein n=1 Tax=Orbilia ellipsospora TaxID=2528407 RepID=A0AAV9XCH3_9PEZI